MAEATSQVLLAVSNPAQKNKIVVFSVQPQATTDLITFDTSTPGLGMQIGGGYSKLIMAYAVDSSTGMHKAIASNGSTILTTVGWTVGDNAWFVVAHFINDLGASR